MDWQTPAALATVALTILIFFLNRKKKSCGTSSCACPKKSK